MSFEADLRLAIETRSHSAFEELLSSVEPDTKSAQTVLEAVLAHGDERCLVALADRGMLYESEFGPPLVAVLRVRNYALIPALVRLGCDPNAVVSGITILGCAALIGSVEAVRSLVYCGANVGTVPEGCTGTAMIAAASNKNFAVVQLLVEKFGANVHPADKATGNTAMLEAASLDYMDIVRYLIGHGAESYVCNKRGLSLLYFCLVYDTSLSDVRAFIRKGADRCLVQQPTAAAKFWSKLCRLPTTSKRLEIAGDLLTGLLPAFLP